MRKEVTGLIAALLLVFIAIFAFRGEIMKLLLDDKTAAMFVSSDLDDFDPGLPAGSDFPGIDASFRGRPVSSVDQFMGEKGMIFVAARSVDWCPYCMRQLAQLQEQLHGFEAAGIAVVAMTYDPSQLQQPFIEARGIQYPLLSDNDAASAIALGILNTQYQPGEEHYGIPYPGIFVINPEGVVVGKLFLEAYSKRVDAASVLAYAGKLLNPE